jgi:hypothetical protein
LQLGKNFENLSIRNTIYTDSVALDLKNPCREPIMILNNHLSPFEAAVKAALFFVTW